jgi:Uma2 family endonuclease
MCGHPGSSSVGVRPLAGFVPERYLVCMAAWRMHVDIEPPYLVVKPDMTEADFYRLANEDSDWEYLDGRIVMHSPASNRHEDLFRFLLTLISAFLDAKGGGVVRGSRYPMRLDPRWSPEPDLLIVRERRRHLLKRKHLAGRADWVIEIVSDSDPRLDYREKLPRYRQAGIDEIWIIDPFKRQTLVENKLADGYQARTLRGGRLCSTVVPELWIDVAWLWRRRLPSTMQCLRELLG